MPKPTTTERTWRLQIFTDRGAAPRIEFLREQVKTYDDGEVVAKPCGIVARSLPAIAAKPLPAAPRTVRTYGELAALIAECGHQLADEDAKAAADAAKAAQAEAEEA